MRLNRTWGICSDTEAQIVETEYRFRHVQDDCRLMLRGLGSLGTLGIREEYKHGPQLRVPGEPDTLQETPTCMPSHGLREITTGSSGSFQSEAVVADPYCKITHLHLVSGGLQSMVWVGEQRFSATPPPSPKVVSSSAMRGTMPAYRQLDRLDSTSVDNPSNPSKMAYHNPFLQLLNFSSRNETVGVNVAMSRDDAYGEV
ncbi:hypothetical protein F4859DRAFT_512523 [Xylaria cf. heliscus]|nr:hypothetical protein F4859DRAFT_512523 [Xylaria cf. heliscus]